MREFQRNIKKIRMNEEEAKKFANSEEPLSPDQREDLKNKTLIIEDSESEVENLKNILGDNIECMPNLSSALNKLKNNPDQIKYVLTDLFYPVGELKSEHKEEFYDRLYNNLLELSYNWEMGERRPEMDSYAEAVRDQKTTEVPSGALLAIYALLKHNKLSNIVTSEGHHGTKYSLINEIIKGSSGSAINLSDQLIDSKGLKNWLPSIKRMSLLEEGWWSESSNKVTDNLNGEAEKKAKEAWPNTEYKFGDHLVDVKTSAFFRLAADLEKYF